jgi:DNA-binding NarL/FixJ family response regulator
VRVVAKVTSREWDVATLMAKGLSNKQVAQHLDVEEGTVKIQLHDIFTKLAVKKNRTVLAVMIRKTPRPDVVEIEEGGAALRHSAALGSPA